MPRTSWALIQVPASVIRPRVPSSRLSLARCVDQVESHRRIPLSLVGIPHGVAQIATQLRLGLIQVRIINRMNRMRVRVRFRVRVRVRVRVSVAARLLESLEPDANALRHRAFHLQLISEPPIRLEFVPRFKLLRELIRLRRRRRGLAHTTHSTARRHSRGG